uniref:Uncharacterized protein n=1 Tax=Moniliophthora roreri TaxID=221103 RepID=A0A0W0FRY0_MONRR
MDGSKRPRMWQILKARRCENLDDGRSKWSAQRFLAEDLFSASILNFNVETYVPRLIPK